MKKLLFIVWMLFSQIVYAENNKNNDVIIIGHGVYDMIFKSTKEELLPFVKECNMGIGDTKLVETEFVSRLIAKFAPIATSFGGSVSNTAYTMGLLGSQVGIYLVLSDEELSRKFVRTLTDAGVKNLGQYITRKDRGIESVMAKVCVFITEQDGIVDRTMFAYDGYSANFSKIKLDLSQIQNYKVLYIEGYSFNKDSKNTIFAAIDEAKRHGVKVAFTPSNPYLIDEYNQDFQRIIDSSDLLFTTQSEIMTLYPKDNIEEAIKKVSQRVDIGIITNGKEGSIITSGKGSRTIKIPVVKEESKIIDTTGAGDGYAAGFLYRYTKGYSVEDSGKAGAIVANEIIKEISARPSKNAIAKILEKLK